jgi:NAD(P)-dependent dehydrogenase (short-subunit alcohol dehydrogenase family)
MTSVLITGTSRGIGLETALAFGRAGHRVHATMRNPSQSPALAETAAREKLPITVSTMDVDSDQSFNDAITAILKDGPIDVLVNNAGVEGVGPVEEFPLASFRAIMETNYFGALRCIQAVVPEMRAKQSGRIINVTSVAGRICCPPLTSYCASKWALEALSEGLAGELKTFNIRVAIVEPGIIDTAMARRIGDPVPGSPYGQTARFSALFTNSLKNLSRMAKQDDRRRMGRDPGGRRRIILRAARRLELTPGTHVPARCVVAISREALSCKARSTKKPAAPS